MMKKLEGGNGRKGKGKSKKTKRDLGSGVEGSMMKRKWQRD